MLGVRVASSPHSESNSNRLLPAQIGNGATNPAVTQKLRSIKKFAANREKHLGMFS